MKKPTDPQLILERMMRRYGLKDPVALERILTPSLIPILELDKTILKTPKRPYHATFAVRIEEDWRELIQPGRTGKFVPGSHVAGGLWREIAKGRILEISTKDNLAAGEIYVGSNKRSDLEKALAELSIDDFWEVDQYGAAAKVLSGLVEYSLSRLVESQGYVVRRMPEDVARHVGAYYYYDFEFEKDGVARRVEVKSLWGTDTRYARLIHSKSKGYETSSCRFATQDFFAVSLFLRTGQISDFAFARSVPWTPETPYGLPSATGYPDYVHQNPPCEIGNGSWFATVDEVWGLP